MTADAGQDWPVSGLDDDMRPHMFRLAAEALPFALATIAAADGGPRPVGSQMVITHGDAWGFLSGGCIEADVALHARQVLADGAPRMLVYGRGSPFIDMRLPCGGRLEILVERIAPGDAALNALLEASIARLPAWWESDGSNRSCSAGRSRATLREARLRCRYDPPQRLAVVGSDPFALAMVGLGRQMGWETRLIAPSGPTGSVPSGVHCDRRPVTEALAALRPDPWTAVAVATHDMEVDRPALVAALRSAAGYVGVLGSRRRLDERIEGLHRAGLSPDEIGRLEAPIGLPIGARSPWEVAVAVVAQIIAAKNCGTMIAQRSDAEVAFGA